VLQRVAVLHCPTQVHGNVRVHERKTHLCASIIKACDKMPNMMHLFNAALTPRSLWTHRHSVRSVGQKTST